MIPKATSTDDATSDRQADSSQRPCIITRCPGTAGRIGEDTSGRLYWYCAACGTECQTETE